jgi:hypothetical protein
LFDPEEILWTTSQGKVLASKRKPNTPLPFLDILKYLALLLKQKTFDDQNDIISKMVHNDTCIKRRNIIYNVFAHEI